MKIIANLSKGILLLNGSVFPITCKVRSLRDWTRASYEVIRSVPGNWPYDPRPFPPGLWNVTGVERQKEKGFDPKTYGPVKIRTDAWRQVNVWELDEDGDYLKETPRRERDEAYLLHYSSSGTTLGCIRLASPEDAEMIARVIQRLFEQKETIQLEVSW